MSESAPTPHDAQAPALIGTARLLSGALTALGIVSVLRTGVTDLGDGATESLAVFSVHGAHGIVWLTLGLVGVALAESPRRARGYLVVAGAVLLAWGFVALAAGASGGPFVRDMPVVVMHLVVGAGVLLVALHPPLAGRLAQEAAASRSPDDAEGSSTTERSRPEDLAR